MVLVKICGLTRAEDARAAEEAGARYGGVILAPGGRRSILPAAAAALFRGSALRRVGVFVDAEPGTLRRGARAAGLHVVQLHGEEAPGAAAALRAEAEWEVWKAVRPRDVAEFRAAVARYAGSVDALLLDGWSPDAPGGTGASFPWEEVAAARAELPADTRLVVAGGLRPDNVATAVRLLRPDAVDVSSGVELRPGVKDAAAVRAFVSAAGGGDLKPEEVR